MKQNEESLMRTHEDKLVKSLTRTVVWAVKFLAVMMVVVIYWSLSDVLYHIYQQVSLGASTFFNVNTLIATLGSFLAVLIAIEIFMNIIFYLQRDAIHVPLVLSTAVTAAARKVIIIDYASATPLELLALSAVIFALGITYWLVTREVEVKGR